MSEPLYVKHNVGDERTIWRTLEPGIHRFDICRIELKRRARVKVKQKFQRERYGQLDWCDEHTFVDTIEEFPEPPSPPVPPPWWRRAIGWFWKNADTIPSARVVRR